MSKLQQMLERQHCGVAMIEHNVGDSGHTTMPRDNDGGHLRSRGQLGSVDGDNSFDYPLHEEAGILLEQVGLVTMANHKVEVARLQQVVLDTCQNQCGIT